MQDQKKQALGNLMVFWESQDKTLMHRGNRRIYEEAFGRELYPKDHEDHIAGKGINSLNHCNLVHKFIPRPQAMNILEAKAAVEKKLEKLEKIPAWQLMKVRNKKEVIDEARKVGVGTKTPKRAKVEMYSKVT